MNRSFNRDPHPGRPKILFVGHGESSHTHSWIDLLEDAHINVRLFALPTLTPPPEDWPVRTYISGVPKGRMSPETRTCRHPAGRPGWAIRRLRATLAGDDQRATENWLAKIITGWRPQIVHTLGLDPAGFVFQSLRRRNPTAAAVTWVLQLRGGSDLSLRRHDPAQHPAITEALTECDQILTDNRVNMDYAAQLGVPTERFAAIAPVPGTGGIDLSAMEQLSEQPTSGRRTILLPKAYESPWSSAKPVLEALASCWDRIQPCSVEALRVTDDVRNWIRALPEHITSKIAVDVRIPREEALRKLSRSRVLLAPSLVDGTPNIMFEAMATGALPIVSPLDTIRPIVDDRTNVLFARNLWPSEIAEALVTAMTDNALVDRIAKNNLQRVHELADRSAILPKVVAFYEELAAQHRAGA